MARLGTTIKLAPSTGNYRVDWEAERIAYMKLKAAEAALGPDEIAGVLMEFPRGDGQAAYLVTKASPLTVSLLDFGDCWTVEAALIRGITKKDVLEHKHRNAAMARLFGRTA
jgi:hypothetical protein